MTSRSTRSIPIVAAAIAALCLSGCAGDGDPFADASPDVSRYGTDPAAERLHDVCGSLLLFHAQFDRLPGDLAELGLATGLDELDLTDPRTGRPFAYAPDGFASSAGGRRIVLLAAPAEGASHRWGVTIVPAGTSMMTGKVVALPVGAFSRGVGPRGLEAGGE